MGDLRGARRGRPRNALTAAGVPAAVIAAVVVAGTAVPAAAAPPAPQTSPAAPPSPAISFASATPAAVASADDRAQRAAATLTRAQQALARAGEAANAAAAAESGDRTRLDALSREEQAEVEAVRAAEAKVRSFAVAAYISGGIVSPLNALLGAQSISDLDRRRRLVDGIAAADTGALRQLRRARDRTSRDALETADRFRRDEEATGLADAAVAAAERVVASRSSDAAAARQWAELVHDAAPAPGTDIPALFLRAYQAAAAGVAANGCRLPWTALAAIGKEESDHGRAGSTSLSAAGVVTPPIVGPALDGSAGNALIPDGDHGLWDADPVFAHAIGPMQFIESTWAVDGRGADPNNIFDAAKAAARLLCAAAPGAALTSDAGMRAAFLSYNDAGFYADAVLGYAHAYAAAVPGGG